MKRLMAWLVIAVVGITAVAWAAESRTKELERVQASQKVLHEIMSAPDKGIPEEILGAAECVSIIPSMMTGGFVFGGRYGKGVATCRTAPGKWSAPAPVRIEGGSWGLQIGGQAVDLVMLVMNQQGMQNLLNSKFRIGADASGAAGPVGRHAEAATDWKMHAQVLTYSRSRGAFVGLTLNGAVLKQDTDDTLALYGNDVSFENILRGKVAPPEGTQPFLQEVATYFKEAKGRKNVANSESGSGTVGGATSTATSGSPAVTTVASSSQTGTTSGGTSGTAQTGGTGSGTAGQSQSGGVAGSTQSGSTTGSTATETAGEGSQPAGASSSAEVQAKIQDTLRNTQGLSVQNVQIDVTDDTVVISGSTPTDKDRATIRRIAQENAGGRKVDDSNLVVK